MSKKKEQTLVLEPIDSSAVMSRIRELNTAIAQHGGEINLLRGECQSFVIEIQGREKHIFELEQEIRSMRGGIVELQRIVQFSKEESSKGVVPS